MNTKLIKFNRINMKNENKLFNMAKKTIKHIITININIKNTESWAARH